MNWSHELKKFSLLSGGGCDMSGGETKFPAGAKGLIWNKLNHTSLKLFGEEKSNCIIILNLNSWKKGTFLSCRSYLAEGKLETKGRNLSDCR